MLVSQIKNDKVRSIIAGSATPALDIMALKSTYNNGCEYIYDDDALREANIYFLPFGGLVSAGNAELAAMREGDF